MQLISSQVMKIRPFPEQNLSSPFDNLKGKHNCFKVFESFQIFKKGINNSP